MKPLFSVISLVTAATFSMHVSTANAADALTKYDVENIVKETIKNNPEIITDSLKKAQEKQRADQEKKAKEALKSKSKELTSSKNSPVVGNPKGDVTVVEFFDYHCGYCKKMLPVISELIKSDKKVRVVFKEFPILSPDSELAAKAALAVYRVKPDKYFDFHTELMTETSQYSEESLLKAAEKVGVNPDKVKKEMNADWVNEELKKDRELADALAIRGTPAFIVGDTLLPGASSLEDLKKLIAEQRKK
jgi:protein-disulfide isomerase